MHSLGINIGSSSIKVVLLNGEQMSLFKTVEHEGDFINTLKNIFQNTDIPADTRMLVTGTEGRYLINANNVIESICVEETLKDTENRGGCCCITWR